MFAVRPSTTRHRADCTASTTKGDKGVTTVNPDVAADGAEDPKAKADPRRWWVLALLSGLQFMILLDMTVVNVALPLVQDGLGFSEAGLTWVVKIGRAHV